MRAEQLLAHFPQLTSDDIRAYLAYAAWEVSPRAGRPKPVNNSQCWVDGPLTASDVPSWGRKQRPATETVP
jgi:hypothetical protein